MPYPTGSTDRVVFGKPLIFLGATGATPTTEVGFTSDEITLEINREVVDLMQGTPGLLTERLIAIETVRVSYGHLDPIYPLTNLPRAFGAGITAQNTTNNTETWSLGGDPNTTKFAMLLQLPLPNGDTIDVRIWRVVGGGAKSIAFGNKFVEIPHVFDALATATNWTGTATNAKGKLLDIELDTA